MASPTKRSAAERAAGGKPGAAPSSAAKASKKNTGAKASERAKGRRESGGHSALGERLLSHTPARIMRPRITFLVCLTALLAFGLLMVYSASSVEALGEYGSSTFFLVNQAKYMGIGLGFAVFAAVVPMELTRSKLMWIVWGIIVLLLLAVLVVGKNVGGATRWIEIGGFQFQPSELAKPVVIMTSAMAMHQFYGERTISTGNFLVTMGIAVAVPLLLIIFEPDFGTSIIIVGTVFVMCILAGISGRLIVILVGLLAMAAVVLVLIAPYRVARFLAAYDPWADPYGTGYQATLAIMAFASGGLFGRGIGNSTMKYNYLPEAHNDYILAIIGEEIGFVGTLIFFIVVAALVYSAYKIAEQSPTAHGKYLAFGCATMIGIQYLINILGITGVTPMTGKPLPFISYGGSAIIGALTLAGLIMRVSIESNPHTVYDARREEMRVVTRGGSLEADPYGEPGAGGIEGSTAGVARKRSARRHEGFTVVDGTSIVSPPDERGARTDTARRTRTSSASSAPRFGGGGDMDRRGSYERVNLGSDPADRLRSRGVRSRYDDAGTRSSSSGRTRGRRDSHDR